MGRCLEQHIGSSDGIIHSCVYCGGGRVYVITYCYGEFFFTLNIASNDISNIFTILIVQSALNMF